MLGRFKGWFSALSKAGKIGVISGAVVLSFAAIGAASPQNHDPKAVKGESTKATPQPAQPIIEHKVVTATENIPFESQTVDDASLADGTNQTQTEGANGIRTKTYDVTLTNGVETSRTLIKEEVTPQPVTQVIKHGTHIATPYRVGATCVDGWPSSATGSGACSHHHGVSCWQYSDGTCRSY